MTQPSLPLIALCAASFASDVAAHGFESVFNVIDSVVEAPYECADYDPATDSCSGVSLMYSEEGILYNTNWFAMPNPGGVPYVFETFQEYEVRMGWGCPLAGDSAPGIRFSSGGQPGMGEAYAQQLQAQLNANWDSWQPCAAYYPTGFRQYEVEFRYPNGDLAEQPNVTVHFFDTPQPIRP